MLHAFALVKFNMDNVYLSN